MLCFLANATTLLKKVIVGLAGTGFPGRLNISNFALCATSAGILSTWGRKFFSAFNGSLEATAQANLIPVSYATYAGFVVNTISPSSQKANGKCTSPSWEPIVCKILLWESSTTLERRK